MYTKGKYYRGLGYYVEVRTTYSVSNRETPKTEHVFSTGVYDNNGAAILNRVKIN